MTDPFTPTERADFAVMDDGVVAYADSLLKQHGYESRACDDHDYQVYRMSRLMLSVADSFLTMLALEGDGER